MMKKYLKYLFPGLLLILNSCEEFPPSEFEIGNVVLDCAYDVFIEGEYAYVTHNGGLAIINISNPDRPDLASTIETGESATGILVENGIAYLGSGGRNNLKIIDVNDGYHPVILSSIDVPGVSSGLAKNEHHLFLSTWDGSLITVSIEDMDSPRVISTLNCEGDGKDITLKGNIAYYANAQKGIQIIDVADPYNPEILSVVEGSYGAFDIHMEDAYLFLGRHNRGFSIFGIEDDHSLSKIYSGSNGGEAWGISREGDRLYIGDLQEGVEIWDVSILEKPEIIETIAEYAPHDLVFSNGKIFLADQDRDFVIIEY